MAIMIYDYPTTYKPFSNVMMTGENNKRRRIRTQTNIFITSSPHTRYFYNTLTSHPDDKTDMTTTTNNHTLYRRI